VRIFTHLHPKDRALWWVGSDSQPVGLFLPPSLAFFGAFSVAYEAAEVFEGRSAQPAET